MAEWSLNNDGFKRFTVVVMVVEGVREGCHKGSCNAMATVVVVGSSGYPLIGVVSQC